MSIEFVRATCISSMAILALGALGCGTQPITLGEGEGAATSEAVGSEQQALGTTSNVYVSDGSSTMYVKSLEGGAVKAAVLSEPIGADGVTRKRLGLPQYEPVTISVPASGTASFFDWAGLALRRNASVKDVVANYCDANAKQVFTRAFMDSTITALTFGPYDVSSKASSALFKETITPTSTLTASGDGSACKGSVGGGKANFVGSNFTLELGQLDTTGVTRIDEIRVVSGVVRAALDPREIDTRQISISNFRVFIAERKVDSWHTWFNDFVVDRRSQQEELQGTITLTAADGSPLLTISLKGVGISRLANTSSDVPGNELPAGTWVADLYAEELSLSRPAR